MHPAKSFQKNVYLRQERLQRHWRQTDLAEQLGTTELTIRRWERGSQQPGAYFRVKLCALFGKSAEELGFLAPQHLMTEETLSAPTNPSVSPLAYWLVPYRRNVFFTGREALLYCLSSLLHPQSVTVITHVQALCGLGGIGKTQIALEYAYRFRHDYHAVFWLHAETKEGVSTDLVHMAHLLGLPLQDERELQQVTEIVKQWLHTHSHWLIILDNVEDTDLLASLLDMLPQNGTGHVLLTSREQSLGPLAQHLEVDKMTLQEGVRFLLQRAKLLKQEADTVAPSVLQDAHRLVQVMDGFPLALDQAGAYIDETGCDLAHYRMLYQVHSGMLLNRRGRFGEDHPRSVAATLFLSFQHVEASCPAAADLLRLCAFVCPDAIPEELFLCGTGEEVSSTSSRVFGVLEFNEALAVLRRYSLIKHHADRRQISIHRVVQTVLKAQMDQNTFQHWTHAAIQMVNRAFPEVEALTTWSQCQVLLSHALACATFIEEGQIVSVEAGRLLQQTGIYLVECALYPQAEVCLRRAQAIHIQLWGTQHPHVAESLNYEAELAYYKGDYSQAEQLHMQALQIRQQHLGPLHPDVATSLHNLAGIYWIQGYYIQAEPLYRQALQIREEIFGNEHVDVAETLQNLAYLLCDLERSREAEPLYRRALTICQQVLGPDHPYLITILNNLGGLYQAQGNSAQAKALYQQAMGLCDRLLDPRHPRRALTLRNLATLASAEKEFAQAKIWYQEALQIRENVLGPDHPRTAQSLHDLALLYSEQGQDAQAIPLYQRALTIREQRLGSDHPDTVRTQNRYTQLLARMSQMDEPNG